MTPANKKIWLHQEENRLIHYQHQHRGISFMKLRLPPTIDREVNMVGLDNHIYKGRIRKVPEDQLPPEVDESSLDEEALYKEIRDMNFPPVPPQEPLGPSRRIGGPYTLAKKLTLAPVRVECDGELEKTLIIGKDGGIYRGEAKCASKIELEKQLRGTKRSTQKVRQRSSARGFIEPSVVTLPTDRTVSQLSKRQAYLVQMPIANVGQIIELVKSDNKERIKKRNESDIESQETKGKVDMQKTEEQEGDKDTNKIDEEPSDTTDVEDSPVTTDVEDSPITTDAEDDSPITTDVEESPPTTDVEGLSTVTEAEESPGTTDVEESQATTDVEEPEETTEVEESSATTNVEEPTEEQHVESQDTE